MRCNISEFLCLLAIFTTFVYSLTKVDLDNYEGKVYISEHVVYEESSLAYDLSKRWVFYLNDTESKEGREAMENELYSKVADFDFLRNPRIRINGSITGFNFRASFSEDLEHEDLNENPFIDWNLAGGF